MTAEYVIYSSLQRGTRKVLLLRAEVGYDASQDRRLFSYGVQVPSRALYRIGLSYEEAIDLRNEQFASLEMPTDSDFAESFPWGKVVAVHRIGNYQIVEHVRRQFHGETDEDFAAHLAEHPTAFHPHIGGDIVSRSYPTLDMALVGVIAFRHDGGDRAVEYVARMLDMPRAEG